MLLAYSFNCFLAGSLFGLILFVLDSGLDRRKGIVTEVFFVSLPVLTAALLILLSGNFHSLPSFGLKLAPIVQFVFLSLPVLTAARIAERVKRGESLQVADLFRATTVVCLACFAATSLLYANPSWFTASVSNVLLHVTLIAAIHVFGVRALSSGFPARYDRGVIGDHARNLALVLCGGFLVVIFLQIATNQSIVDVIPLGLSYPSRNRQGPLTYGLCLLALCTGLVMFVPAMRYVLERSSWLHQLSHRISTWRFALGDPSDLIHVGNAMQLWHLRPGVCYLNHGSFGAAPTLIRDARDRRLRQLESEPTDMFVRHYETAWRQSRFQLATWLLTHENNISLCENATAAMNEIAGWFPLAAGDEVLLNDHEYGAVRRIWERRCRRSAAELITARLPHELLEPRQIVDAILAACTPRTRLVVASHITSPTAIRMPIEDLCRELKSRDIAVCIDGPHALLQEPLRLYDLGCDFYTASCHKWLCAPLGTGFVYVDPRWHALVEPLRMSWGRLQPNRPECWNEELLWTGTRDISAMLTIPDAIQFFERFDREQLDQRNHALAVYARRQLLQLPGAWPVTPEGREWFGWMVAVGLPAGDHSTLQNRLWDKYRIEVPIMRVSDRHLVRVSCPLYVTSHDIDFLVHALRRELPSKKGADPLLARQ